MSHYWLTPRSYNSKTGPIAVSTTSADTCPPSCPLGQDGTCYAAGGKLALLWRNITAGRPPVHTTDRKPLTIRQFLAAVKALLPGSLFRHNQAGDLPGTNDRLDAAGCLSIDGASHHLMAWTYTHYPPTASNLTILQALQHLTVNLSANNPTQAVEYHSRHSLPVATVVPHDWKSQPLNGTWIRTCPAQLAKGITTCASCGAGNPWCARKDRTFIVGFKPEGQRAAQMQVV